MSGLLPVWAMLAIRWIAAASCPLWLGLALLIAFDHLFMAISLIIHPDDMLAGESKALYRRLTVAEPFLIGSLVPFTVGVLAPSWKFRATLIIGVAPILVLIAFDFLPAVLNRTTYDEFAPTMVQTAGVVLGLGLGSILVLKVYGNGKEAF